MALFTEADFDDLAGQHVTRAWFGEFDLPSGYAYLHDGVGEIDIAGHTWKGVSSPLGGQLVSVSAIDDPRFGQAAKVDIVLAGITADAWKQFKQDARDIEGRTAILRFASFDPETGVLKMFKPMMPGKISSPSLHRKGVTERYVGLVIEGFWEAQNYPFGGRWNYADQLRRYAGDKGGQFIGQKVAEQWA